jgi:hypothetical protein
VLPPGVPQPPLLPWLLSCSAEEFPVLWVSKVFAGTGSTQVEILSGGTRVPGASLSSGVVGPCFPPGSHPVACTA